MKQIRMIADLGASHECSTWIEKENAEEFAKFAVNVVNFQLQNPAIRVVFEEREVEQVKVAVKRVVNF